MHLVNVWFPNPQWHPKPRKCIHNNFFAGRDSPDSECPVCIHNFSSLYFQHPSKQLPSSSTSTSSHQFPLLHPLNLFFFELFRGQHFCFNQGQHHLLNKRMIFWYLLYQTRKSSEKLLSNHCKAPENWMDYKMNTKFQHKRSNGKLEKQEEVTIPSCLLSRLHKSTINSPQCNNIRQWNDIIARMTTSGIFSLKNVED